MGTQNTVWVVWHETDRGGYDQDIKLFATRESAQQHTIDTIRFNSWAAWSDKPAPDDDDEMLAEWLNISDGEIFQVFEQEVRH